MIIDHIDHIQENQQKMTLIPIKQRDARAFINAHHRHNKAPRGSVFQIFLQQLRKNLPKVKKLNLQLVIHFFISLFQMQCNTHMHTQRVRWV